MRPAALRSDSRAADLLPVAPLVRVPDPRSPVEDPARLAALRQTQLLDALPSAAFDRLTRMTVRVLGVPTALISLVDRDRQFLLSAHGLAQPWADRRQTPLTHTFCRTVVERGMPLAIADARNVAALDAEPAIHALNVIAYAGMPLRTREGHVLGTLCTIGSAPRAWTPDDLQLLEDLAATVMAEIELRHLTRELVTNVRTDPVTGLGNRREWEEAATRLIADAALRDQPLVLALLDLDRFRRFNERHGNHAGDALLRETALAWQAQLRDADHLVRLGGVQFALLLPATSIDPAFDLVEALRDRLTSGMTCVAGVALLRAGETAAELLARADVALHRARRSGRNASALAS